MQNFIGRLEGGIIIAPGCLQLGDFQTRRKIIGTQPDGFHELLPRLFEFPSGGVRASQVVMRYKIIRRSRDHALQFGDGLLHVTLIQQQGCF